MIDYGGIHVRRMSTAILHAVFRTTMIVLFVKFSRKHVECKVNAIWW